MKKTIYIERKRDRGPDQTMRTRNLPFACQRHRLNNELYRTQTHSGTLVFISLALPAALPLRSQSR